MITTKLISIILLYCLIQILFTYGTIYSFGQSANLTSNPPIQNISSVIKNNTFEIDQPIVLSDQIIVHLNENASSAGLISNSEQLEDKGIQVINSFNTSSNGYVLDIETPLNLSEESNMDLENKTLAEGFCGILKDDPDVKSCSPNFLIPLHASHVPIYNIPMGVNRIDAENVTELIKGGGKHTDIDIAIIDSGVNFHPDLNVYKSTFNKDTRSFIELPRNASTDRCPGPGHGTHVAGIAAAKGENGGIQGVSPGSKIWSLKAFEPKWVMVGNHLQHICYGYADQIQKAIDYVTEHADEIEVLNLSFGYDTSENTKINYTEIDIAINAAVAKGVTVVVSAGNSNKDASTFSPARNPTLITVSNVADSDGMCGGKGVQTFRGPDDTLANNSNFGSVVDIAAPGVLINSTSKDLKYKLDSGTSMAAPHVAGAVALYKSIHPEASPEEIRGALISFSSNPLTKCKQLGDGHGYFSSDHDTHSEPLLHVKNLFLDMPTGVWNTTTNGLEGILNITTINNEGKINGTLSLGEYPITNISGNYDRSNFKIHFSESNTLDDQPIDTIYIGQVFRDLVQGTINSYIISGITKSSTIGNEHITNDISPWYAIRTS